MTEDRTEKRFHAAATLASVLVSLLAVALCATALARMAKADLTQHEIVCAHCGGWLRINVSKSDGGGYARFP